jgi:hypothetical protein
VPPPTESCPRKQPGRSSSGPAVPEVFTEITVGARQRRAQKLASIDPPCASDVPAIDPSLRSFADNQRNSAVLGSWAADSPRGVAGGHDQEGLAPGKVGRARLHLQVKLRPIRNDLLTCREWDR